MSYDHRLDTIDTPDELALAVSTAALSSYWDVTAIPGMKTPYDYGYIETDASTHQAAIDAMITSDSLFIVFPPGLYHAYINNKTSNRTFLFEEGAIIDGVIHIATGDGPETSLSLSIVKNVRCIGTVVSTVRVGTYYCQGVNIDKIRITEVNSDYTNQTIEGGTRGVHFYFGSKDITVGDVDTNSTAAATAAFFCDTLTLNDATNRPDNITIGNLRVRTATTSAVVTTNCDRFKASRIYVDAYLGYNGIQFTGSDVEIGKIDIDGASTVGSYPNVYILNNTRAYIGDIVSKNARTHGVYISGSTNTFIDNIDTYDNLQDGVRVMSPVYINKVLTHNNTQMGIQFTTGAGLSKAGSIEAYANVTNNVYVTGLSDVSIDSIITYNASGAAGYGLFLNNCTRFRNDYLSAYGNVQGLRYIGNTDTKFGVVELASNTTTDLVTSGTTVGFYAQKLTYTTLANSAPSTFVGFQLTPTDRRGTNVQAVASGAVTLTVKTDYSTQIFNTILTADITVTLATTGATAGNKWRVVRGSVATGAFNINIGTGPLKALASASTWAEFEYSGSAWLLVGAGSL